jgi:hypothetical protein
MRRWGEKEIFTHDFSESFLWFWSFFGLFRELMTVWESEKRGMQNFPTVVTHEN